MVIRIYLDMCCYKRPFDDQHQERVRLEALAVRRILERSEGGEIELVRSPALELENSDNPREDRRLATAVWLDGASVGVHLSAAVERRTTEPASLGFRPLDALHVVLAEESRAKILATCDDQLLGLGERHRARLAIRIESPTDIAWGKPR